MVVDSDFLLALDLTLAYLKPEALLAIHFNNKLHFKWTFTLCWATMIVRTVAETYDNL